MYGFIAFRNSLLIKNKTANNISILKSSKLVVIRIRLRRASIYYFYKLKKKRYISSNTHLYFLSLCHTEMCSIWWS